ncbi:hypothetical protein [Legionella spiritensis]|uniref:hypothetical protein n=1 Tax=Legionella spiritensis TaxID=452 RepID=UPI000F6F4D12|nr:hypothetical protein [Legionella spiritensis]VEG90712.1 Uncharacterised protein [Legionella spiritensis]
MNIDLKKDEAFEDIIKRIRNVKDSELVLTCGDDYNLEETAIKALLAAIPSNVTALKLDGFPYDIDNRVAEFLETNYFLTSVEITNADMPETFEVTEDAVEVYFKITQLCERNKKLAEKLYEARQLAIKTARESIFNKLQEVSTDSTYESYLGQLPADGTVFTKIINYLRVEDDITYDSLIENMKKKESDVVEHVAEETPPVAEDEDVSEVYEETVEEDEESDLSSDYTIRAESSVTPNPGRSGFFHKLNSGLDRATHPESAAQKISTAVILLTPGINLLAASLLLTLHVIAKFADKQDENAFRNSGPFQAK